MLSPAQLDIRIGAAVITSQATMVNVRVIRYRERALRDIVSEVVRVLEEGGVVILPTDTCYGLAADATSREAVAKVFEVKHRPWSKPVSIFLDSVDAVRRFFVIDEVAKRALKLLPGYVTLILRLKSGIKLPRGVMGRGGCVGVRVSPHPLPRAIVESLGRPITATSANRSGKPPIYEAAEAAKQLPEADLVVDAGALPRIPPSTVIDLTIKPPRILRIGPVPPSLVKRVLGTDVRT